MKKACKQSKDTDKIKKMNGIIFCINPLIIELENGQHFPREKEELMFYVWSKEDIERAEKRANEFKEFFSKK